MPGSEAGYRREFERHTSKGPGSWTPFYTGKMEPPAGKATQVSYLLLAAKRNHRNAIN